MSREGECCPDVVGPPFFFFNRRLADAAGSLTVDNRHQSQPTPVAQTRLAARNQSSKTGRLVNIRSKA